jgi:hypothetical protein
MRAQSTLRHAYGVGSNSKDRWQHHPEWTIEEIYGIIETGGNSAILKSLGDELRRDDHE